MNLPSPTDHEVAEFAVIYERLYGIHIEGSDAHEIATRILQLYYLVTYGRRLGAPEQETTEIKG